MMKLADLENQIETRNQSMRYTEPRILETSKAQSTIANTAKQVSGHDTPTDNGFTDDPAYEADE
jgi:hypothetical protein